MRTNTTTGNAFGLMATPAPATIAAEHAAALDTLDFNKVVAESSRPHPTAGEVFPDLNRLKAELPDIIDQAMRKTAPGQYTPEAAQEVADTMLGMLTGQLCPVWPTLCTDTTPGHLDHFNHDRFVADKHGKRMIDVSFIQFTDDVEQGPVKISIGGMGNEDYAPSEVREATAKIRRLLDEADAMADTVMRIQGEDVPPPSARAFTAAREAIDAAFEASTDHGGTRDALRTYVNMTASELAEDRRAAQTGGAA